MKPSKSSRFRLGVAALLASSAALALSGCNAAASDSGSGSLKIGVTVANSTNPFFQQETKTAEKYGKEAGAEVLSQVANEDVQTQSNQIDQFITSGVSFIVIDAADTDGVGPAVKRAISAGIPVIGVDNQSKNATVNITTDNTQAGEISCKSLAEQLGGKGKVAILNGTPVSAVDDRVTGCKRILEQYPGIKIVADQRGENSRDSALPIATDILTANPDINGFFAINDPTAVGVKLAAEQKGVSVIITSVDGASSATDVIAAKGLITATAAQDPAALMRQAIDLGISIKKGKQPEKSLVLVPTELVDASNVSAYTPWG
ncbi:substrate-binding domain-containing protein [Paenarthrobacter aromaticivorans]|uniref:Substrate-binding domain-containing protein n=1 Tax=Paenarthrobacter aromaticivorans TaxID=2849150 RepID=A0ABS6I0E2_9MICC|nr:substrate-binding domain-containing protein [Paenarthrobacter sp. MMS21-TAE1-1]MBU8864797.1 substrate-binding domain-containing protein [Paenarthrobacter sp. MMS21-TAE1-1]